jgi:hypothetical protein
MRSRKRARPGACGRRTMKGRPVGRVQDERAEAYRRKGRCESGWEPTTEQRREVPRAGRESSGVCGRQEATLHGANEHLRPPVVEWMVGLGTKCGVHRVGADFARRRETRQAPSIPRMVDVMRARIASTAKKHKTPFGSTHLRRSGIRQSKQAAPIHAVVRQVDGGDASHD